MAPWDPWGKCEYSILTRSLHEEWRGGDDHPDFFVVDDDMYGLSVRVEASWTLAKPVLFEELAMFLHSAGNGVCILLL